MSQQQITTICTMDCPDSCALTVTVANGTIRKIAGSRDGHPDTDGFICRKVGQFARRVYHKDRVLYPMRRTGPKGTVQFSRISWAEAAGEIAHRFQEIRRQWGGEAILPFHYGGSNGLLGDEFLDHYFFARLGASRCEKTLCAAPTTAVAVDMYGKMPGVAYQDYPNARFILIWGANPKVSHIHLMPYLRRARRNGAFIAVVDPRKNYSDGEVDLHLPVYPGADLPLALGMIHYWTAQNLLDCDFIDRHTVGLEPLRAAAAAWPPEKAAAAAGVLLEDLILLARQYAESSPAVLRCGWGVERNINGGQAVAAILAMPALLGKFGRRGGGYTLSNSGAIRFDRTAVLGDFSWQTRRINQSQIGQILTDPSLDPPLMALYVYNANPVATAPDQNALIRGLRRQDLFTVVHEQVLTDTAAYADLLLPAVTFLEQYEIKKAYGSYVAGGVRPVIAPRGEALPNEAVFALLGRAMGWDDPPFQWDTEVYFRKIAAALDLNGAAADAAKLRNGGIEPCQFSGQAPVQFQTVFPLTPDGKIQLTPPALGSRPFQYQPVPGEKYPLALISPASSKMISSTLGEFNYSRLTVTTHPDDARARGISAGDIVRIFNDLGEVRCYADVSPAVRPGVAAMPKGAWRKASLNAQTATALCPQIVNPVAGGACFNDARVEIERHSR